VLLKLGVELQKVRNSVEFIIGRGDRIVLGQIGLTPRAKKVIELAIDEARQMNHHYIGTEHLLLGLVREGEGIAAGVLESLGVRLEQVRKTTLAVLSGISPEAQVISPPVPEQAAALVVEGEPALTCSYCGARSPGYFHYCFNCGERLAQE
jgi:ATP-dependent Clp protease ATP-binding subunit ClpA